MYVLWKFLFFIFVFQNFDEEFVIFVGLFDRVSLDFFGDMSLDEVLVFLEFFFIVVDILDQKLFVKFVVIGVVYNYLL